MEGLTELRDGLRKAADLIDEMLALKERGDSGEDVNEAFELLLARFAVSLVGLSKLGDLL